MTEILRKTIAIGIAAYLTGLEERAKLKPKPPSLNVEELWRQQWSAVLEPLGMRAEHYDIARECWHWGFLGVNVWLPGDIANGCPDAPSERRK